MAGEAVEAVRFDAVHHTLRATTLGSLAAGSRVNLEHAATPATLLGGHLVQGHVDEVGEVLAVATDGGEWRVRIAAKPLGSSSGVSRRAWLSASFAPSWKRAATP